MTYNSHISLWLIAAKHLHVHPRSSTRFEKSALSEGLPYLYQKLPALGKALDQGLDTGKFDITSAPFRKRKGTELPLFLYELFRQVFEDNGFIKHRPIMIRELRQLLMMFYKFETEPTTTQVVEAGDKFIKRDSLVGFNNLSGNYPSSLQQVRKNFMSLLPNDPKDISLHHSNGATADHIHNTSKAHLFHRTPAMEHFGIGMAYLSVDHANASHTLGYVYDTLPPAQVVQVPKDARGPRSICKEPHTNMKYQLGLMRKIYSYVETRSPAKGFVNFTNQMTNRHLARLGSKDRCITTIDLKDASDMVSWDLIQELVSEEWRDILSITRSTSARVNSETVEFKKFAPMGSALCFPVEAILFWSIARTVAPVVWVYGDDIIVGREYAHDVIEALESYSLIVNRDKTLHDGLFRESCGGEYYRGHDISYIKCKSYALDRFIAFANLFGDAFGHNISDEMMDWYEKHTGSVVYRSPLSESRNAEAYVFYTNTKLSNESFKTRWNQHLQHTEVRRLRETIQLGSRYTARLEQLLSVKTDDATITEVVYRIRKQSVEEQNLYINWLQGASPVSPLQEHADQHVSDLLRDRSPVSVGFEPDVRISGHAVPKPRTIFGWGVHNPVRALIG